MIFAIRISDFCNVEISDVKSDSSERPNDRKRTRTKVMSIKK